jgi:bacterioferritin-associated ferredoxin
MYVCICHAITERQVVAAVREGACTLRDLSACLGVATGCGQCACQARELIAAHAPAAPLTRSEPPQAHIA